MFRYAPLGIDQRSGIADASSGEHIMHIIREKHKVFGQCPAVGGVAEAEVHAKMRPGLGGHIRVQELAHGRTQSEAATIPRNGVREGFFYHIADTGGAVVVEKIVLVVAVLFQGVFLQKVEKPLFLRLVQIQDLLLHGALVAQIATLKTCLLYTSRCV